MNTVLLIVWIFSFFFQWRFLLDEMMLLASHFACFSMNFCLFLSPVFPATFLCQKGFLVKILTFRIYRPFWGIFLTGGIAIYIGVYSTKKRIQEWKTDKFLQTVNWNEINSEINWSNCKWNIIKTKQRSDQWCEWVEITHWKKTMKISCDEAFCWF